MTPQLLLVLAALTYGSRAAALALLPPMPPTLLRILDRMPAPLFAGLAAQSLVGQDGALVASEVLAAGAGALIASPLRSLPACLLGGLGAWVLVDVVLG